MVGARLRFATVTGPHDGEVVMPEQVTFEPAQPSYPQVIITAGLGVDLRNVRAFVWWFPRTQDATTEPKNG